MILMMIFHPNPGMEVCPVRLRSFYGINYAIPYALMMGFMGVVGWAIRDWQPLNAIYYIPLYLMLIFGNPWLVFTLHASSSHL